LQLGNLLFCEGTRAESQDVAFVHSLQQVQSLAGETPPTMAPHQSLSPLCLGLVTQLKACQGEPAVMTLV